jgi:hypothetical protein
MQYRKSGRYVLADRYSGSFPEPISRSGRIRFSFPRPTAVFHGRSAPGGLIVNLANPEVVIRFAHRLVLALLIVVIDTAAFAVPLASVLLAHTLLARPAWVRDWVDRLYRGVPR